MAAMLYFGPQYAAENPLVGNTSSPWCSYDMVIAVIEHGLRFSWINNLAKQICQYCGLLLATALLQV